MTISELIRQRRTAKDYDGRPITDSILKEALDLANWAPNHKLNQPWRFRVMKPSAVQRLLHHLEQQLKAEDWKALEGPVKRVAKAGAVIFVTSQKDSNEVLDWENYAATCAGIENLMLYAVSEGIGTYWSTGKLFALSETRAYLELKDTERFVGAIWMGYGKSPEAPKRKQVSECTEWLD